MAYPGIDFTPPAKVRQNAKRALAIRATKPESGRGMTAVGIARARDLSSGREVSPSTARRMVRYFSRHEIDKQGSTWSDWGKGRQAWNGWGGDAGRTWALSLVAQMDRADRRKDETMKTNTNEALLMPGETLDAALDALRKSIKAKIEAFFPEGAAYSYLDDVFDGALTFCVYEHRNDGPSSEWYFYAPFLRDSTGVFTIGALTEKTRRVVFEDVDTGVVSKIAVFARFARAWIEKNEDAFDAKDSDALVVASGDVEEKAGAVLAQKKIERDNDAASALKSSARVLVAALTNEGLGDLANEFAALLSRVDETKNFSAREGRDLVAKVAKGDATFDDLETFAESVDTSSRDGVAFAIDVSLLRSNDLDGLKRRHQRDGIG